MRDVSEVDPDLLRTAVETYDLERHLDTVGELAVEKALEAVLHLYEKRVVERIARGAEALAESIREEDTPSSEGAASLDIFARELRNELPYLGEPYAPMNGDLVELTLVGEVTVYEDACPNCGNEGYDNKWSVRDRYSGLEYYLDEQETKNAHIRVISRGEPDLSEPDEDPYVTV